MKKLQGLIYFSFFFLLLACGTTKDTGRGTSPTPKKEIEDEKTRLLFEQVFLSAEKEKALGRNQDAIRDYKEALDIYPNSSGAHFALADLYLTEGRVDLAYTSINAAIKLETQIADYYDLKAQICHSLSKHVEAAKALEEIIRLQPGNVDAYFDAANQYIYAKDYKSALLIYDKMEDRFGVGEDLIRQKEQLYLRLGKANKAIEEVKKLVDAAPGDTRYQGMLAELYWTVGKQSEAVTLYREILEK